MRSKKTAVAAVSKVNPEPEIPANIRARVRDLVNLLSTGLAELADGPCFRLYSLDFLTKMAVEDLQADGWEIVLVPVEEAEALQERLKFDGGSTTFNDWCVQAIQHRMDEEEVGYPESPEVIAAERKRRARGKLNTTVCDALADAKVKTGSEARARIKADHMKSVKKCSGITGDPVDGLIAHTVRHYLEYRAPHVSA